jgi:hypothetical protein
VYDGNGHVKLFPTLTLQTPLPPSTGSFAAEVYVTINTDPNPSPTSAGNQALAVHSRDPSAIRIGNVVLEVEALPFSPVHRFPGFPGLLERVISKLRAEQPTLV